MPVDVVLGGQHGGFFSRFSMDMKSAGFLVIDPDHGLSRHDVVGDGRRCSWSKSLDRAK
jgi:hypothetical protein